MAEDGGKRILLAKPGLEELAAQVKTCQLCRLSKTRTQAVPGSGSRRAEVVFIGEGPGYHEDKQGMPFVGAAGNFLNELLQIADLSRDSVYITNVVKCRPPNNRDPQPDEIAACAPYLERQIALVNPKVIVTLGRYSMSRFFPGARISQIHGTAQVVEGRLCVAMYHPAAGLHQASLADVIRSDFVKLPVYIAEARRMVSPPIADDLERISEADEAREEVVHEKETSMPLKPALETPLVLKETLGAPPEPAPVPVELSVKSVKDPAAPRKARITKEKERDDYKQLSFFDL